jgi:beta-N-acetylhexosaminidase
VRATFFVVGEWVHLRPETEGVLRRMRRDGDAIGDHSYTHHILAAGGRVARRELRWTDALIRRYGGAEPCVFRPPYGAKSARLVALARREGMTTVNWDVDPSDYFRPGAQVIADRVLHQVRPGSIVLMHDGGGYRDQTVAALPQIIERLRARGYRFATVPRLLGLGGPRPTVARPAPRAKRHRRHHERHRPARPRRSSQAKPRAARRALTARVAVTARTVPRPRIIHRPIPFGARRRRETAAYARRHYGIHDFHLRHPHVIVEHIADAPSFGVVFNTFAPDVRDPELHELPGTCAHFVIDRRGRIYQLVPLRFICRHTVGLNWTAIGIEHVGFRDADLLHDRRQLAASLKLTRWLRCRFHITVANVIGHNESLRSPYHHERVRALRSQTHDDMRRASMNVYRRRIRRLGGCR